MSNVNLHKETVNSKNNFNCDVNTLHNSKIDSVDTPLLDKLAQLRKIDIDDFPKLQSQVLNKSNLAKRARAKYLGKKIAIDLVEANPNSHLLKSYRNSLFCTDTIVVENGIPKAHYCKNRWCPVCNRNRTGAYISKYEPILSTWEDKYMVTLTLKNVGAVDLPGTLDTMQKTFRKLVDKFRKRGFKLVAVRKLEVTYNAQTKYHPHYHILVDGKSSAQYLYDEWQRYFPNETNAKGQDIRKADDGSMKELFKYMTKLSVSGKQAIPPTKLDVIFRAMYGRRTIQNYGFKVGMVTDKDVATQERIDLLELVKEILERDQNVEERIYFDWDQDLADWVNRQTGELLINSFCVDLPGDKKPPG